MSRPGPRLFVIPLELSEANWFGDINLEARHERECWDKNGATR